MKHHGVSSRAAAGFTLIEVLAALVIVGLGMLAVIEAVTQTVNNASYLRDKTVAHWVAMNKLTEVRLASSAPTAGESNGDLDMAGVTWHWRMAITATDVASMLRIDVNVAPKSAGETASIASVSGFYGTAIASASGSRIDWDITPGARRNRAGGANSSRSSNSESSRGNGNSGGQSSSSASSTSSEGG